MGAKPNVRFCSRGRIGVAKSGRKLPVRFGAELPQKQPGSFDPARSHEPLTKLTSAHPLWAAPGQPRGSRWGRPPWTGLNPRRCPLASRAEAGRRR